MRATYSTLAGVAALLWLLGGAAALADPPSYAPAKGYRRNNKQARKEAREQAKRIAERDRELARYRAERDRELARYRAEQDRERTRRRRELEREDARRDREWEARRDRDDRREYQRDRYGNDWRDYDRRSGPRVRVGGVTRYRLDLDRDGVPDSRDRDIDGDGYRNTVDRYPRDRRRH